MRQFLTNCFQEQKRLSIRRTTNKPDEIFSTNQNSQQSLCSDYLQIDNKEITNTMNSSNIPTKRILMRSSAVRINNMSCDEEEEKSNGKSSPSLQNIQRFASIKENAEKPLEDDENVMISPVRKRLNAISRKTTGVIANGKIASKSSNTIDRYMFKSLESYEGYNKETIEERRRKSEPTLLSYCRLDH